MVGEVSKLETCKANTVRWCRINMVNLDLVMDFAGLAWKKPVHTLQPASLWTEGYFAPDFKNSVFQSSLLYSPIYLAPNQRAVKFLFEILGDPSVHPDPLADIPLPNTPFPK